MSFDASQLRFLIVKPVLIGINMWSQEAEDLMMGTAAQESLLGKYIKQDHGPALGIFQMEPRTHDDIWTRYLTQNPKVCNDLMITCKFANKPTKEMLVYNLFYAAAMTRVFYRRIPDTIPRTLEGQAEYWKTWYNTPQGAGSTSQYIANYNRFILGKIDKK